MAEIFEQNKKKYWKNAEGDLIPVSRIYPHEKKSDKLVESLHKRIEKLQEKIKAEKVLIVQLVQKYLDEIAADYNEEWEGNTTIYNFDKTKQIEVRLAKHFVTDERLNIAKKKIDNLIMKWSDGASDNIIALVNKAFKIDRKSNIDIKQILGLRELKIKDKEWKEAMDLISDSITADFSKTYFNFRKKNDEGKLIPITLNFSAL